MAKPIVRDGLEKPIGIDRLQDRMVTGRVESMEMEYFSSGGKWE